MSKLNENHFRKHLAKKIFYNIYMLYGEEKFLVKHYTDLLTEKIMGPNLPEFNYHLFDNNSTLDQIANGVQVLPFMSEYNCVTISDLDIDDLSTADFNKYMDIFKIIPNTTILIITMPTLERNMRKTAKFNKVAAYVEEEGALCEFQYRGEMALERQLISWSKQAGATLTNINAGKIIEYCGKDLYPLRNELNKLCAYVDGGEITLEVIESLVVKNLEAKIFALADAVISGRSNIAYNQLNALFYQQEEPVAIVNVLGGTYIDAYRARVAAESGEPIKTVIDTFNYRNRAFVLDKAQRNTRNLSTKSLRESIDALILADTQLKSTSVNQQLIVEKLIAQLLLIVKKAD